MKDESKFIESLINPETRDLAFEKLVQDYKKPIYWHIRKIVLDHDDAHDVLQNTFLKVFKGIDKFKFESKLYTWIYRIATNESLNFMCEWTNLIVNNNTTPFTNKLKMNQKIPIPIANGEGRYFVEDDTLNQLKKNNQIVFSYENKVNGSISQIAIAVTL